MEKNLPPPVADAIDRLTKAIDRLDAATATVPGLSNAKRDLASKLDDATRQNEILREAANRVAARLDGTIGRLSQALKD